MLASFRLHRRVMLPGGSPSFPQRRPWGHLTTAITYTGVWPKDMEPCWVFAVTGLQYSADKQKKIFWCEESGSVYLCLCLPAETAVSNPRSKHSCYIVLTVPQEDFNSCIRLWVHTPKWASDMRRSYNESNEREELVWPATTEWFFFFISQQGASRLLSRNFFQVSYFISQAFPLPSKLIFSFSSSISFPPSFLLLLTT